MYFGGNKNNRADAEKHFSYFNTKAFAEHREKTNSKILSLPFTKAPRGWHGPYSFTVSGLQYIGFSGDSKYLLVVSSDGIGLIDIETKETIARDYDRAEALLDERNLVCTGIGILENESIRLTGIGGGGLPLFSGTGDSLFLSAPLYPCYDVIFQPKYQHCLIKDHSTDCSLLYRGFVKFCGFSWDGNVLAAADSDIQIWIRDQIKEM